MGFNLSAFGAGFAEAYTEDIQRNRKLAELRGAEAVKNMQLNYKKVIEDNKTKENDLLEKIDLLKTYDPNASQSELYAIANKPAVMNQITSLIKDKAFDPASFKLSNFVKVAEENPSTATAVERVKLLSVMPNIAKESIVKEVESSGNIFKDMTARSAAKAQEKAMLQQAETMGIPLERLRAAQQYVRPTVTDSSVVDMSKLRPAKTFAEQEDEAKAKLLFAIKNKDANAENLARADVFVVKTIKDSLTSEQTKFADKLVTLKNASLYGTPAEKKLADAELSRIWELEKKEAIAKKIPDKDTGEGKVPALGTLNTFVSAAVGRAIAAQYGDLVKSNQIAMVEKPDGGVSITYTGTDAVMRGKIRDTQAAAARSALSLYTDKEGRPLNRDVASVINSFTTSAPSAETPGTAPAAPAAAARSAPALPTPGRTTPTPAAPATASVQAERAKANAAIASGKDPAAVRQLFKQTTGQDL